MKQSCRVFSNSRLFQPLLVVILLLAFAGSLAAGQQFLFQLDPQHTGVNFTLGDVLHTLHGTFLVKQGSLTLDPASGTLTGELVVDANSGNSGSGMRELKMHKA